jgi:hypothetical protein
MNVFSRKRLAYPKSNATGADFGRILRRHEDLTAIGQQREDAVGLLVTVETKRKIRAPHRLKSIGLNLSADELGSSQIHSRVEHIAGQARPGLATQLVALPHQHGDFSTKVLFVELGRILTVATVVEVGVELHDSRYQIDFPSILSQGEPH